MPLRPDTQAAWRIQAPTAPGRTRFAVMGPPPNVEHDSFLWTLTDLMTLLLIFFVLLYSNAIQKAPITANPIETGAATRDGDIGASTGILPDDSAVVSKDSERVATVLPEPAERQKAEAASPPATHGPEHTLLADLEKQFSEDFYVRWEDRLPVIVLGERITFNMGEAMLLPEAHDALNRVAQVILRMADCRVMVTGHTDDRPIQTRTFPSNWELSAARAASVAKALMENGISPDALVIQGKSRFKPLVANTSAENRRINRRVEISLITGNKSAGSAY